MKRLLQDILKLLKIGLMIIFLALSLIGCTSDQTDNTDITGIELEGEESELDEEQRACWQAGLLNMFYNAMSESSMKAYPKVTGSAMPFIMVAFAIWLSIRLLKHVSSVVEEAPAEVWTEVSRMAFLCLLCGILASSTTFLLFVLNKLIFPIYYAFLEYGSRIVELAGADEQINPKGQMIGSTCMIYTNSLICKAPELTAAGYSNGQASFPSGPSEMMQCLVCATSDRLQMGFLIAKEMLAATSLTSWVSGALIFCIFVIVKVAFVFYLIDSIFRMNIVVIILPCLILAVPFKFSRKWAKEGLMTILNSSAIMMCIAIVTTMAMLAMQTIINDNYDYLGDKQAYQEFGIIMLCMILIAFLVLKSIGLAVSMANSLVKGAGGTDFQKKIAKLAAWAGKKLLGFVTGGIGSGLAKMAEKSPTAQAAKDKAQSVGNFLNKMAGRDKE